MDISFDFLENLQRRLQRNLDTLAMIVEQHGRIMGRSSDTKDSSVLVHDYIFLCLTKGTRSLSAADILITESHLEDSLIIARTGYECYLNGAYVFSEPEKVRELLIARIGLASGALEHPLRKSGKPDRTKVRNTKTGCIDDYGTTIYKMACSTNYNSDEGAHVPLYKFLSEYSHVNIISAGAFWASDHESYSVEANPESVYPTLVICIYVSWLLLDLAVDFLESKQFPIFVFDLELEASSIDLVQAINDLQFDSSLEGLKVHMLDRIAAKYG